jgi:hypothetical protein
MSALNIVALVTFVGLIGAGLFGLLRRLALYATAEMAVPVLLKRDVVLLFALSVVGMEALGIRGLGIVLDAWPRVAYVAQQDLVVILAVAYWVKVELRDVDDPSKS